MSRSGYSDEGEDVALWRGQVANAIRGKRGQQFLRDLVDGLDALPEKVLIAEQLQDKETGCVCALGAVGVKRGVDLAPLEPFVVDADNEPVAKAFNIAVQLACEVQWINDEASPYRGETPRARWERVRNWAISSLHGDLPSSPANNAEARRSDEGTRSVSPRDGDL